jgi:hypothetical protein
MRVVDDVVIGATTRGGSTIGVIRSDDRRTAAILMRRKTAW